MTVTGKDDSLPWKDTSPMQQRKAFIDEYLKKEHSVSELCRRFEVSRKTAALEPARDHRGAGGFYRRGAQTASELGPKETPGGASFSQPRRSSALREHVCSRLQAQRADHAASAPSADAAFDASVRGSFGAERAVVHAAGIQVLESSIY